jgi:GMP synthase PP-ATPase subunit
MNRKNDQMEKSRLQWEKQAIMDLSGGIDSECTNTLIQRYNLFLVKKLKSKVLVKQ